MSSLPSVKFAFNSTSVAVAKLWKVKVFSKESASVSSVVVTPSPSSKRTLITSAIHAWFKSAESITLLPDTDTVKSSSVSAATAAQSKEIVFVQVPLVAVSVKSETSAEPTISSPNHTCTSLA